MSQVATENQCRTSGSAAIGPGRDAGLTSVLFPGQGSQTRGMGAGLFERFPELTGLAVEVLGYDLPRLCLEDPDNRLDETRYTQPALYVVNALSYLDSLAAGEPEGDFLLGHSLGEYNALLAAGAFDFETGLKLVIKRGELMSRACAGAMLAVVGLSEAELRAFVVEQDLTRLDIANLNTPTQAVLSGPGEDITRAQELLDAQRVRVRGLRVSAPFHSRYMEPARHEFAAFVKGFQFAPLRRTVIANATARPYDNHDIAQVLCDQISGSVRWADSIRYLLLNAPAEGCREVGTSGVLTRMLRQFGPTVAPVRPKTRPRLFCVAYAGGDERAYAGLTEHCPDLDVITLERPGRGRRTAEQLLHDPVRIVDDLFAQLRDRLDEPYALYGHSLGARLAFMLCRRLRREGLPAPRHLVVSGECGPAIPSREADTWRMPKDEFWQHLRQLGGVPAELLRYQDLMNFYEPVLRADFAALGAYAHEAEAPLDLPITAVTGDQEWFSEADIDAWQRETRHPLRRHRWPGDHFFIRAHWAELASVVISGFTSTHRSEGKS